VSVIRDCYHIGAPICIKGNGDSLTLGTATRKRGSQYGDADADDTLYEHKFDADAQR
jgi:hypothetical protein